MEQSSYFLSKHAYVCLADNHYVFLDLRSGEYLCLGRTHTDMLKLLLGRHHLLNDHSGGIPVQDARDSKTSAVIQALLQKELLVQDETCGKPAVSSSVEAPALSLMNHLKKRRSRIGSAHLWNFFAATATASKDLRWGTIERTVRKVEDRKLTYTTGVTPVDCGVITDLFGVYQSLRPYYPRPYLCLFDSLALLHFLARFGVFPQWIYGVKLKPFAAHCWVQAGDVVINDIVDNVREYTPIMSI